MWSLPPNLTIRSEAHFGERVVRCFAERAPNVDALFRRSVEIHANSEALIGADGERITYAALDAMVSRVAANLAQRGLRRGDRVALLLANRPEFAMLLLAAARLGAIAVPINIRSQTPEIEYVLGHCGAKALVHEADLTSRLPNPARLPELKLRFAAGGASADCAPFSDLLGERSASELAPVDEEDTAIILYTSGTTGQPKGAMLTHFNLVHSVMHYVLCLGLRSGDRSLLAVPASHVTGTVAVVLPMLTVGGGVVFMQQFKAKAFLQLASRERMTHALMVPAMYNLCLLDQEFDSFDLSAWRIGGYGGAPMPEATIAALAQKLPGLSLVNAYGSTETTSPVTLMPPGKTAERPDSVGIVVPCGELLVMDETGREVAPGEQGELWIAGPMVVPGYWNNPEATQASFPAGFWRSGDIGSIDRDGYVRVFDRKKDLINRGGYKVYSIEVENALAHHPQVLECAVVPVADPVLGEKTLAVVVRRGPQCDPEDLRRFCAARLSDYKVPDFFALQDEPLPRNANGKVLKRELRSLGEAKNK
jgi:long-chain acyl-CoA synthetase